MIHIREDPHGCNKCPRLTLLQTTSRSATQGYNSCKQKKPPLLISLMYTTFSFLMGCQSIHYNNMDNLMSNMNKSKYVIRNGINNVVLMEVKLSKGYPMIDSLSLHNPNTNIALTIYGVPRELKYYCRSSWLVAFTFTKHPFCKIISP